MTTTDSARVPGFSPSLRHSVLTPMTLPPGSDNGPSVPGTTPAKSCVPPSTASPIASSSRSVSSEKSNETPVGAGPAQQGERDVGRAGVHHDGAPSWTASDLAQRALDDLPVDGAVGAVAAGGPDLAAQDGGQGGLVELEDDLRRRECGGVPPRGARAAPRRASRPGRGRRPGRRARPRRSAAPGRRRASTGRRPAP